MSDFLSGLAARESVKGSTGTGKEITIGSLVEKIAFCNASVEMTSRREVPSAGKRVSNGSSRRGKAKRYS
ncbi:hypothetical protein MASR1M66_11640 [Aminivibrio sp.]